MDFSLAHPGVANPPLFNAGFELSYGTRIAHY
jgi:hypothetical protein